MTAENLAKVFTPTLCDVTCPAAVRRIDLLHKAIKELIEHGEFFFGNGTLNEYMVLNKSKTKT